MRKWLRRRHIVLGGFPFIQPYSGGGGGFVCPLIWTFPFKFHTFLTQHKCKVRKTLGRIFFFCLLMTIHLNTNNRLENMFEHHFLQGPSVKIFSSYSFLSWLGRGEFQYLPTTFSVQVMHTPAFSLFAFSLCVCVVFGNML